MPIRKYEQLLKPLTINSMEVSNRVVMPPITTVLAIGMVVLVSYAGIYGASVIKWSRSIHY